MRYDKYDLRGALHWEEYENHTYYEELVNDSLVPFDEFKEMFSEFELEEIPITNETYFAYKIMNK